MGQVIITGEIVLASTATTIVLDGALTTRPIKTINSAIQIDSSVTATTAATGITVVSDTPDAVEEIQLYDENTVKVYLTVAMVAADAIIMNVEFVDELVRT